MRKTKNDVIYELLEDVLKLIESDKLAVTQAVQKLLRAAELVGDESTTTWCRSQIGASNYIEFFRDIGNMAKQKKEISPKYFEQKKKELNIETHPNFVDELNIRASVSSGGQDGIAFAEEKYKVLVKEKRGNDNVYYRSNLSSYINFVKKETHERASNLFNEVSFSHMPETTFDILRYEVEDKLFELNPEFTEQLLNSFKRVCSNNDEDWAQALTTCRRLMISLSDQLYPSSEIDYKQRPVGEKNYVNRIWAYMDTKIESSTDRELAQRHLEYFKFYIDKDVRLLNKGVHANVQKLDAIKAIHHTYLILADILQYISVTEDEEQLKSVDAISYEDFLKYGVKKDIAKKIIRFRVDYPNSTIEDLIKIEGVGVKTIEKIRNGCK